jgi:hypothetical protein
MNNELKKMGAKLIATQLEDKNNWVNTINSQYYRYAK